MDKQNLVIVPFMLPWDWSADYQMQTCLELSKENLVISYLHYDARFFLKKKPALFLSRKKNIIFYQPIYLFPFRRFPIVERLNQLINLVHIFLRYGLDKRKIILWIFDPIFWFYPKIKKIYPKVISIYDCVDYVWQKDKVLRKKLQDFEKRLICGVDYFFVNSRILKKIHSKLRHPNAVVPQGFRLSDFEKPKETKIKFPRVKPIVGYVGSIDHRLDMGLLEKVFKSNRNLLFILWGPIQEKGEVSSKIIKKRLSVFKSMSNVIVGKSNDRRELPNIISQFDVGMIPYDTTQGSVRFSYPMKVFEYFYMEKPVISTPVEELGLFPEYIKISNSFRQWKIDINSLLDKSKKQKQKNLRKLSVDNSWKNKITVIFNTINKLENDDQ